MKTKYLICSLFCFVHNSNAATTKEIDILNGERSQINFQSSKEKSEVKLSIFTNIDAYKGFRLDVTGAIGDDETSKDFADFDGLNKGVKIKATYIQYSEEGIPKADAEKLGLKEKLHTAFKETQKLYLNYLNTLDGADKTAKCNIDQICQLLSKNMNDSKQAFNDFVLVAGTLSSKRPWWQPEQYLYSAAANRNDFSVLDLSEFKSNKENETGVELGFAAQWLTGNFHRLKLGIEFQRAYEQEGDSKQYCKNQSDLDGILQCIEGNTNSVAKNYNRNLYMNFGGYNSREQDVFKGWDMKITHNFSDSKTGVEVPLYFYANKTNEVNAGIKFGLIINGDDDDDETTVSVFFGTALDIF